MTQFTVLVRPLYDESGAALRRAFDLFDADGSGFIDRSELSVMLRRLGFGWQGAHVFAAADADGDGKVNFHEFVELFGTKKLTSSLGKKGAANGKGGRAKSSKVAAAASK